MAASFSHNPAGTPDMAGAVGTSTVIVVVATFTHCPALGVKVNVIFPLKPAGLKLFDVTPVPDQLPVIPLCDVGNETGASV